MMFFTKHCAPMIYQVFSHEWLATVSAARRYLLSKAFEVIRHARIDVKTSIKYGLMTSSAKKVLWVPGGPQGSDIVSPDGLFTVCAG